MLLELQKNVIYGPVQSRRLGRSLGVNVLPAGIKVCTFDCLYCQYGWTRFHGNTFGPNVLFPSVSDVLDAVKTTLESLAPPPAYITFSGNGEPTLHPDFPHIVQGITKLRDRFSPGAKTAILSNATTVSDPAVRDALANLDIRIMKFECGTSETFKTYNRPCRGIDFDEVIDGLASLPDVTIQALFTSGPSGNYRPEDVEAWMAKLKKIAPAFVQLYTLDRGTPSRSIFSLTKQELLAIKTLVESQTAVKTKAYS